jgi:hypothetical protein
MVSDGLTGETWWPEWLAGETWWPEWLAGETWTGWQESVVSEWLTVW